MQVKSTIGFALDVRAEVKPAAVVRKPTKSARHYAARRLFRSIVEVFSGAFGLSVLLKLSGARNPNFTLVMVPAVARVPERFDHASTIRTGADLTNVSVTVLLKESM